MTDLLDKDNKHIFLEKPNNTSNSFIANLNRVAARLDEVKTFNDRFSDEQLAMLHQLGVDDLGHNLDYIAEDLAKNTYRGYRKLDIDLLTNFIDYDPMMTNAEKLALWNDPNKQVYYNKARVTFSDSTVVERTFDTLVSNHRQLFDQFEDWKDEEGSSLVAKMGDTAFNIMPSDPLPEHELLRFYDSAVDSTTQGSLITSIQLIQDPTAYSSIAVANTKVKTPSPVFSWADTTSSLLTIANRIQTIIYTAGFIENVGADYVLQLQMLVDQIELLTQQAQTQVDIATTAAETVMAVRQKYETQTANATPIGIEDDPTVEYDPNTNSFNFGLPRNGYFVVGLSDFVINTENGHLSLTTFEDDDVESIVLDNATGKIIITVNAG